MTDTRTIPHEHRFTFLRQEDETLYYGTGRIRETVQWDVFFCEGCLEYKRVEAKRQQWH